MQTFGIIIREDDGSGRPEVDWSLLGSLIHHLSLKLQRGPIREKVSNVVFDERLFRALAPKIPKEQMEEDVLANVRVISKAADLALTLFAGDREKTRHWLTEKNSYFFDRTPVEAIFSGSGASVVEMLSERLGIDDSTDTTGSFS